jgi:hypothetical protein
MRNRGVGRISAFQQVIPKSGKRLQAIIESRAQKAVVTGEPTGMMHWK